jgi:hypothetical protein
MASRPPRFSAACLVILSLVAPPTTATVQVNASAGSPILGAQTALPGTLELRNTRWERVRVEVRVGPSQNCDQNNAQGSSVLRRDESWAVISEETVCWRRERVPNDPSAGWTAWEQSRLAPDQVRTVTL